MDDRKTSQIPGLIYFFWFDITLLPTAIYNTQNGPNIKEISHIKEPIGFYSRYIYGAGFLKKEKGWGRERKRRDSINRLIAMQNGIGI